MRRNVAVLLALFASSAASLAMAQEAWLPKATADLILLDKIRAVPTDVAVKVGDTAKFGSISIHVDRCVIRPPDQPADAAVFVTVSDSRGRGDVFRGWLLAKTPSVSTMEHPVYDLRLAGCR